MEADGPSADRPEGAGEAQKIGAVAVARKQARWRRWRCPGTGVNAQCAYVGLGANLGDDLTATLQSALHALAAFAGHAPGGGIERLAFGTRAGDWP